MNKTQSYEKMDREPEQTFFPKDTYKYPINI